jgi:hypothetical protein
MTALRSPKRSEFTLLHTKAELLLIARGFGSWTGGPLPSVTPNHTFCCFFLPTVCCFVLSFSRTSCQTSYHSQAEYSRSLLYANYLLTVALYIHSVAIGLPNLRNPLHLLRLRRSLIPYDLDEAKPTVFTENSSSDITRNNMRYSYTALVLATLAFGNVIAGPFHHAHLHQKKADGLLNVEA